MKSKLNLNKIRLYCILHNVRAFFEIPSCWNCQEKGTCSRVEAAQFLYDNTFRKFWPAEKKYRSRNGGHWGSIEKKEGEKYFDEGCNRWQKER